MMKRDVDLIRTILIQLEEHEHGFAPNVSIEGVSNEVVGFHCHLIIEAGLANGCNITSEGDLSPKAMLTMLTNRGYNFVENTRVPSTWEKVKAAGQKAGSMGINTLVAIATELATRQAMAAIGSP